MKNPFKGCVIATCGDFGKSRSTDRLKQWIELNGGKYSTSIDRNTTHLVCSKDRYKKPNAVVDTAKAAKHVKIVSYDWLEDSLLAKRRKADGDYLLSRLAKAAAKKKVVTAAARRKQLEEGVKKYHQDCKDFTKDMLEDGYYIYRDPSGLEYNLTLVRADMAHNINERYYLKLYETHQVPCTYACFATYSSPRSPYIKEYLAGIGSSWESAFQKFREFFEAKTKRAWENRLVKNEKPEPAAFVWNPPPATEPQGETRRDTMGLNGTLLL